LSSKKSSLLKKKISEISSILEFNTFTASPLFSVGRLTINKSTLVNHFNSIQNRKLFAKTGYPGCAAFAMHNCANSQMNLLLHQNLLAGNRLPVVNKPNHVHSPGPGAHIGLQFLISLADIFGEHPAAEEIVDLDGCRAPLVVNRGKIENRCVVLGFELIRDHDMKLILSRIGINF
jgi:hypothetical protein